MSLPIKEQLKYWGVAAVVLLAVLWLLGDILMPFILGAAMAYFLDPIADRLERLGLSRIAATIVIALVALLLFALLVLTVIPTLISQLTALIEAAPEFAQRMQTFMVERFPELQDNTSTLRQTIASIWETVQSQGGKVANGLISTAFGAVSVVVFLLIVPVVAFYLLLDWDRMIAAADRLIPRQHAPELRIIARDVDRTLSGFIRGQFMVCLIQGSYFSVALMLAGLQFGMIVGAIAGAISFIPYVGAVVGGVLAIGLALFQFWGDWLQVGIVIAIFAFGQFVEGNILTPKLVGNSVGLHPVWLMLALAAFGSLFGFVGMLVAVPLAAVIGVLVRYGLQMYQESGLYQANTLITPDRPQHKSTLILPQSMKSHDHE